MVVDLFGYYSADPRVNRRMKVVAKPADNGESKIPIFRLGQWDDELRVIPQLKVGRIACGRGLRIRK